MVTLLPCYTDYISPQTWSICKVRKILSSLPDSDRGWHNQIELTPSIFSLTQILKDDSIFSIVKVITIMVGRFL